MCRLMLFGGSPDKQLLRLALKSFRLSAQFDVVLDSFRRGRRSHNHGWGATVVAMKFGELMISYFRTSLPILEEDFKAFARSIPRDAQWLYLLLHARLASQNQPIDALNSHPIHVSRPGAYSLWLAHNGTVDKRVLAEKLGLTHLLEKFTDTYFIAQWIARNVEGAEPKAFLESLKSLAELGVVESALNVAGIVLSEGGGRVFAFALNYVSKGGQELEEYYRLHLLKSSSSIVIGSSTIFRYLNNFINVGGEGLRNGEAVVVEVKNGSLSFERLSIL